MRVRPAPGCEIWFSDLSSSHAGVFYRIRAAVPGLAELEGDVASDCNYLGWWQFSILSSRNSKALSRRDAERIAQGACREFGRGVVALDLPGGLMRAPGCDVMLSTDRSVYVVVDFPDWVTALVGDYVDVLPKTFGKAFGRTAYDGKVIFRSPWSEVGRRAFAIHDLRDLEIWYDEERSGGEVGGCFDFAGMPGVQDKGAAFSGDSFGAVVSVASTPEGDKVRFNLTNGSAWVVGATEASQAGLNVGEEVVVPYGQNARDASGRYKLLVGSDMSSLPAWYAGPW